MQTADVVIVGGGVMGCSLAYHLACKGVKTTLLERESQVGAGSTGRCSGGVRHQFSHPVNVQMSIASIRKLEAFEEVLGWPIDLHQDGYLFLLTSDEAAGQFAASVAMQQSMGVPSQLLDAHEIAKLVPHVDLADVKAGAYCARDGIADPNGVTAGYARKARALGAQVLLGAEVVAIDTARGRVAGVRTATEGFSAPVVVNAGGPWAARIGEMAGVRVPVEPYRRHVFVTRGFPKAPPTRLMVLDFETSFYFHREGDGVLMGMGEPDETPSFSDAVDWGFLDHLIEVGVRRYPPLANASIRKAWAGLYEMTPDANPIIGEAPTLRGFFLAAGFSGHGFSHGPIVGEIVADLIVGLEPRVDVSSFGLARFEGAALRREAHVV